MSVDGLRANQEELALTGHARRGFQRGFKFILFHLCRADRPGLGKSPMNGLDWRRRRASGVSLSEKQAISTAER